VRTTEEGLPSRSQGLTSGAHWQGRFWAVMGVSFVGLGAAKQETRTIRGRSSSAGKRRAENWADDAGTEGAMGEGDDAGDVQLGVQ
jgi:hypothetical protein